MNESSAPKHQENLGPVANAPLGNQTIGLQINNYAGQPAATPRPRPWHTPHAADQFFGREAEIDQVADLMREHRVVALIGPGGMGKTALAAEAIRHLAPDQDKPGPFTGGIYSHDYYVSPGHPDALVSIVNAAGLGDTPDRDRPGVVKRLLDRPGVLLYLEGCEKAEQLHELLNLTTQAGVLVTTRDPDKTGGGHPHEVHPLDPESAAKLLHYHATFTSLPADTAQRQPWLELARRLGHHPLALRLAGTYLHKRKLTPAVFLQSLTQQGFKFWDTNQEPKENLRVMFQHCADAAKAKHARALEAWFALALHAHAPVPLSALCGALATQPVSWFGKLLAKVLRRKPQPIPPEVVEPMLDALQDYSLAEPNEMPGAEDRTTERAWQLTHALLGEWAREQWLPQRSAELRFGAKKPADPAPGRRPALPTAEILNAWLDWWNGNFNHCFKQKSVPGGPARYQALQPHWNALLTILEQIEGNDSTRLSLFLNATASAHQDMGNYSAAEPLYRRALESLERVLGPEHPATLASVNNLAGLLQAKGDLAAAEPLYRRALEARERVLGPEHPATLASVNNLAGLLQAKGDWAAAEPLYRRGLEACERVLGPEHPDTLASVNNLAMLLRAKGDWAAAEPLYRRGLESLERVLGPEHPATLTSVNNLAYLLQAKGDLAGALPLFERAAQGLLHKLGPDHPHTKACQRNLARLRQELAEQQKP